jgi:hypothetical protein
LIETDVNVEKVVGQGAIPAQPLYVFGRVLLFEQVMGK